MDLCEELAEKVTEALVREKLVSEDDATRLRPKISAGKMSQSDWKIAVEKRLDEDRANAT
jgi:hypothetical protein